MKQQISPTDGNESNNVKSEIIKDTVHAKSQQTAQQPQ